METIAPRSESSPIVSVDRTLLTQLALKLLQRRGMFAAEAEIVVSRQIEADQCGQFANGVGSLPQYLDAMDQGDIDPRAKIITRNETSAVALLDGSTGIGHVAATRGMRLAIDKARAIGVGTVVIKNSRLCGDVGAIARLASESGMIGFVTNSFVENVADESEGSAFAWGFPASAGSPPLVVRDRSPNPAAATSLALSLLTAGLGGGESMTRKRKASRVANTVEHFVQAIDPAQFGSLETLLANWGPTLAARLRPESTTPGETPAVTTVPLQADDARTLSELAAKIKFDVTW